MRILVACECSGVVRDAFRARGHAAISCDLKPCEVEGVHYQGDVRDLDLSVFDMLIGFPPCTYLCNSGIQWLNKRKGRWTSMLDGVNFFNYLWNAPVEYIALENPRPHRYALELIPARTQIIQPYEFGEPYSKETWLWLKSLPELLSTKLLSEAEQASHNMWPSPERSTDRARFLLGPANAMAQQWGSLQPKRSLSEKGVRG